MGYITTYTGINFNPLKFTEADLDIEDIAHSLALKVRWGGHCSTFFSVAQHSVYVARFMEFAKMVGLIHDGSESVTGDMVTPFKAVLPDFRTLEDKIQAKVYNKFYGRQPTDEEHNHLKIYDRLLLDFEGTLFIKNWQDPIDTSIITKVDPAFFPWNPQEAEKRFLEEFRKLV